MSKVAFLTTDRGVARTLSMGVYYRSSAFISVEMSKVAFLTTDRGVARM